MFPPPDLFFAESALDPPVAPTGSTPRASAGRGCSTAAGAAFCTRPEAGWLRDGVTGARPGFLDDVSAGAPAPDPDPRGTGFEGAFDFGVDGATGARTVRGDAVEALFELVFEPGLAPDFGSGLDFGLDAGGGAFPGDFEPGRESARRTRVGFFAASWFPGRRAGLRFEVRGRSGAALRFGEAPVAPPRVLRPEPAVGPLLRSEPVLRTAFVPVVPFVSVVPFLESTAVRARAEPDPGRALPAAFRRAGGGPLVRSSGAPAADFRPDRVPEREPGDAPRFDPLSLEREEDPFAFAGARPRPVVRGAGPRDPLRDSAASADFFFFAFTLVDFAMIFRSRPVLTGRCSRFRRDLCRTSPEPRWSGVCGRGTVPGNC